MLAVVGSTIAIFRNGPRQQRHGHVLIDNLLRDKRHGTAVNAVAIDGQAPDGIGGDNTVWTMSSSTSLLRTSFSSIAPGLALGSSF